LFGDERIEKKVGRPCCEEPDLIRLPRRLRHGAERHGEQRHERHERAAPG